MLDFFKKNTNVSGKGLFASIEELMEQRRYIGYVKQNHLQKSRSVRVGDVKSAFKGRGVELEEIRLYNFGDDIRDIDWRVSARKQDTYTKVYLEEKDREVYVLLDLSSSMVFGTKKELKSVMAAKVSALLGWLSLENKDRFGCVIFDGESSYVFKPQNYQAGLLAILKKISDVSQGVLKDKVASEVSLIKPLQLLQKSLKSQGIVFVISDFYNFDENVKKSLAVLNKNNKIYCVNVVDALEILPPVAGEYMVQNGSDSLVFNSGGKSFSEAYIEYFAKKHRVVQDFCRRFSVQYMEVNNTTPIYKQIKI